MEIKSVRATDPQPLSIDTWILSEEPADSGQAQVGVIEASEEAQQLDLADYRHSLGLPKSVDDESLTFASAVWQAPCVTNVGSDIVALAKFDSPEMILKVPKDMAADFHRGDRVIMTETILEQGWFSLKKVRVDFVPDSASPPLTVNTQLPLMRLHSPKRKGCSAEYNVESSSEQSLEGSIEFVGLGGGAGQTITYVIGHNYSTEGPRCIEIFMPATVELQFGATRVNGTPVSFGFRAHIRKIDGDVVEDRKIPADLDQCGWTEIAKRQADSLRRFKAREVTHKPFFKRSRSVQGKVTVGLELLNSLKIGLDYAQKSSRQVKVSAKLVPGASYHAYSPRPVVDKESFFEVCWTSKPLKRAR